MPAVFGGTSSVASGTGWGFWVDGDYLTQASTPFSVSAATRTKLPNNGASALTNTDQLGTVPAGVWDTTNDKLVPELYQAYNVRVTFKCQTASAGSGNYVELDLDIGSGGVGTGPKIWASTKTLAKGQGIEHSMAFAIPLFALAPFPTTGGTFYVTPNVALDVWDIRIFVDRLAA